jgi:phosphatidylglycerol---prolipoprotein diacylglyceryl transferase
VSLPLLAEAAGFVRWEDLGLDPILVAVGPLAIRWYSLAYIVGILLGWWYMLKLIKQPGAPLAQRHVEDLLFWVTIGIILGGRLGYVTFYRPEIWANPLDVLKLWEGGMSFHGGMLGVFAAFAYVSWRGQLNLFRVGDYICCCAPFGLLLGRIANFINGELWGRATDVPWAVIFPGAYAAGLPRHPSQLYEAALEGLLLMLVLGWAFWRTNARYWPGFLGGLFLTGYGLARFIVEFYREPDEGIGILGWGLTMGQTLCLPMLIIGLYLMLTAKGRRSRVEPIAGPASVS